MLKDLSAAERLNLMKFVCSFAWADLQVQDEERSYVTRMMKRLKLDEADQKQVAAWLEVPPPPEDVDPSKIPAAHRQLFLKTMRDIVEADHEVAPSERENLKLFEMLLR